jgi:hypothetical protein
MLTSRNYLFLLRNHHALRILVFAQMRESELAGNQIFLQVHAQLTINKMIPSE